MDDDHTTHHGGCACHEARHAAEIARLTAERDALAALARDVLEWAGEAIYAMGRVAPDAPRFESARSDWEAIELDHAATIARVSTAPVAVGDGGES